MFLAILYNFWYSIENVYRPSIDWIRTEYFEDVLCSKICEVFNEVY